MDRTERFYTIDRLLRSRRQVSLRQLMEELEVSRATVRRDLEYMRDRMAAPIVWDAALRGYCYRLEATGDDDRYALPGLWFNASEVYALLTMDHLLSSLQPGLLEPHIEPLRERIRRLLGSGEHPTQEIEKRIRILYMASRQMDTRVFASIANALLARRRLFIVHLNRRSNLHTERVVSPQRLAHYRDNWYLDCGCCALPADRSRWLKTRSVRRRALSTDRAVHRTQPGQAIWPTPVAGKKTAAGR